MLHFRRKFSSGVTVCPLLQIKRKEKKRNTIFKTKEKEKEKKY